MHMRSCKKPCLSPATAQAGATNQLSPAKKKKEAKLEKKSKIGEQASGGRESEIEREEEKWEARRVRQTQWGRERGRERSSSGEKIREGKHADRREMWTGVIRE